MVPEFPEQVIELDAGDVSLFDEKHAQALLLVALMSQQCLDLKGSEQIQKNRLFTESTGK